MNNSSIKFARAINRLRIMEATRFTFVSFQKTQRETSRKMFVLLKSICLRRLSLCCLQKSFEDANTFHRRGGKSLCLSLFSAKVAYIDDKCGAIREFERSC